MSFRIGEKVVCVNDRSVSAIQLRIKQNAVYTISKIGTSNCSCGNTLLGFNEIEMYEAFVHCSNCRDDYYGLVGMYQQYRFRKLSDYGKEESEKIVAKIETEMEIIEPELV